MTSELQVVGKAASIAILRVILQIEKCLTGAEAEEKRGAAESQAPTDSKLDWNEPKRSPKLETSGAGRQLSPSLSP